MGEKVGSSVSMHSYGEIKTGCRASFGLPPQKKSEDQVHCLLSWLKLISGKVTWASSSQMNEHGFLLKLCV